jgi:hypothetical protein
MPNLLSGSHIVNFTEFNAPPVSWGQYKQMVSLCNAKMAGYQFDLLSRLEGGLECTRIGQDYFPLDVRLDFKNWPTHRSVPNADPRNNPSVVADDYELHNACNPGTIGTPTLMFKSYDGHGWTNAEMIKVAACVGFGLGWTTRRSKGQKKVNSLITEMEEEDAEPAAEPAEEPVEEPAEEPVAEPAAKKRPAAGSDEEEDDEGQRGAGGKRPRDADSDKGGALGGLP